ncbi:MAG TPA: TIGR03790 family protein [Candidatus Aquilonibacter sp.]|nr:TIGR03790 family protein [Candidatus Aquilonibacter sp.]
MKYFAVLFLALAPLCVRAGGNEVVVVYNKNMPGSKGVAEHYAEMRAVPQTQIFGFDLTTNEVMSRAEFHDSLQMPLLDKLVADKLWIFGDVTNAPTNGEPARVVSRVVASKIRYAVLCYGVPLKIAPDPDVHEAVAEKMQPELRRNEAAVDSELAWLPLAKMEFPLTGPFPNWLYCTTNVAQLDPTNGILLVARLDGPTAEIANGLVDKAMEAERNGLWGHGYFDARGLKPSDTNYFLGDEWIIGAAEISRALGFETTVDDKPETFPVDFPMSSIALYCGWYDGNVSGPFTLPKVEFMPGAFAYHLHSFSAATLRSTTENWCGPLLAKGATCTMGCVYEPYLGGTPNVAVFLARWMAEGLTFGEAAWAAQPFLSWQTTVIGDPLYRPFAKSPQLLHAELLNRPGPLLDWSYLRLVDLALVRGAGMDEVSGLLENLNATTNSAVLTEKLADLYEAEGKPDSAILTWQQALERNPSPEQRIRLRLTLGKDLQAQDRDAEAIDDYKKLIDEAPDYPGKYSIEQKIAALEQMLVSTNSVAKP